MISTKKYRIRLTTDEQQELNALVSRGRAGSKWATVVPFFSWAICTLVGVKRDWTAKVKHG